MWVINQGCAMSNVCLLGPCQDLSIRHGTAFKPPTSLWSTRVLTFRGAPTDANEQGMPTPRRAQSEGAAGRYNRPRPPARPFVPGVSYSVEELDTASATVPLGADLATLVRNEQQRRVERARRNFLDRSLRDARPTPPTVPPPAELLRATAGQVQTRHTPTVVPPPTATVGQVQVINTAVPVIPIQTDTSAGPQTSAVSHTEAASMEPPTSTAPVTVAETTEDDPEQASSGYLQAALNVLKSPFRANKKRAHSGSSTGLSSEVNPSPRVHLPQQQQEDHPMGQDTGDSTAAPTVDDESTKRLKVDESNDKKPDWFVRNMEYTKAWNERQERLYKEQEEKRAADLQGMERRLPDKMLVPRNTAVVYEDTASASMSQASQEPVYREKANYVATTSAKFYCPCCPSWHYTPQKRYLHLAMQHTVYLPQLGGKMQDDFAAEGLYVIPLLSAPIVRGGLDSQELLLDTEKKRPTAMQSRMQQGSLLTSNGA
eukprot:877696-Amphidinium_carterae.2